MNLRHRVMLFLPTPISKDTCAREHRLLRELGGHILLVSLPFPLFAVSGGGQNRNAVSPSSVTPGKPACNGGTQGRTWPQGLAGEMASGSLSPTMAFVYRV